MVAMIVERPVGFAALTEMRLYASAAHTGEAIAVALRKVDDFRADAPVDQVPPGRYFAVLVGSGADGSTLTSALRAPVDLPLDERLAVSPEACAVTAGITLPLGEARREVIVEAILTAQADVYAYLGRQPMPQMIRETGRHPWPDGWHLDAHGDEPIITVLEALPEQNIEGWPTGLYTVTYLAGINARDDVTYAPIQRFIKAHAMNSPEFVRMWKSATKARGDIRSISAEGQSVSWTPASLGGGGGRPGDGSPGSLPTLASLDRWRVAGRRVHQGPSQSWHAYDPRAWSM